MSLPEAWHTVVSYGSDGSRNRRTSPASSSLVEPVTTNLGEADSIIKDGTPASPACKSLVSPVEAVQTSFTRQVSVPDAVAYNINHCYLGSSRPRRLLGGEAGVLSTDTARLPYYTFAYVSPHTFTTTDMASRRRLSSRQGTASTGKSVARQCHTSKRTITRASSRHGHTSMHGTMTDRPQRKVRKACVRCRMKKIKVGHPNHKSYNPVRGIHGCNQCDGEIPCKRCKDDEWICAASVRRTIAYKRTPRG